MAEMDVAGDERARKVSCAAAFISTPSFRGRLPYSGHFGNRRPSHHVGGRQCPGLRRALHSTEQTLRAHVQWRRRDEMGVSFAEEARDSGSPAAAEQELARRVEKLEAEIAALKKVLKRLKADLPTGGEDAA